MVCQMGPLMCTERTSLPSCAPLVSRKCGSSRIHRERTRHYSSPHLTPIWSLAWRSTEPPAAGILVGTQNGAETLKEFAIRLAPAREALKVGDTKNGIPLFVDGIGGPGAYDRRSAADKNMNADNAASYLADATTKRPRAAFTCDMAKAIAAPVLLSNGERSQHFFFRINDQLIACLPNSERIVVAQSSHTVPSENPDAYDQAVLTFLAMH